MTIEAERRAIEAVLDDYRARIDNIPDDQFDMTPPDGGWSYAEVYSHILQTGISSALAIEKCSMSTCKLTSKGRSIVGLFVLTFNRFPPIRVKVPAEVAAKNPAKKISKEEARNLLIKCRKKINDVIELIHDSSPNRRVRHPRMGMLNAGQWLKFILVHSKHHLRQLDRIAKGLRVK